MTDRDNSIIVYRQHNLIPRVLSYRVVGDIWVLDSYVKQMNIELQKAWMCKGDIPSAFVKLDSLKCQFPHSLDQ